MAEQAYVRPHSHHTPMDDIISNMGDTVFAVGLVVVLFVFAFLTAAVRSSRTKEYLKKHPIKKCPFCAELVKLEAKVCKHCGRDFAPVSPVSPQPLSVSKEKFYYSTDGEQQGPVDAGDLKLMWQDGLITNDTLVIREGDPEWRSIRDYLPLL